jgi:hypothetical protein
MSAQAQTPDDIMANMGRPSCRAWLSSTANEHDGESWLYGFWSGFNQATQQKINIGPNSNVDLMIAEMKTICKAEPSSTLVAAALRVVEMSRQGIFTGRPPRP